MFLKGAFTVHLSRLLSNRILCVSTPAYAGPSRCLWPVALKNLARTTAGAVCLGATFRPCLRQQACYALVDF